MPIHSFIVATEPLGAQAKEINRDDVAVASSRFVVDYFRMSRDGRLVFGGGESYRQRPPRDVRAAVRPALLRVYPKLADARIDYAWSGIVAVTRSRLPHIGRLDPNLWFAHGYSGHGIGMALLAGKLIAEAIDGNGDRLDLLRKVEPHRFPGGRFLRWPTLVAGMTWYSLRDRL
jgi:gamma-glutamylputrescine oxidase